MNTRLDCDRARIGLSASIDGEASPSSAADREHASTCPACRQWFESFESLGGRLQDLPYPGVEAHLWPAVRHRILTPDRLTPLVSQFLLPAGVIVLGWRALQLFIDLPMPALHPLVPLLAAIVVMWRVGGDLLTIETIAPELRKRGI